MRSFAMVVGMVVSVLQASIAYSEGRVDEAARILTMLCVNGGSISISKSQGAGDFRLHGNGVSFNIEKIESVGLVDGINNAISQLASDQASSARRCMMPYIDRIMNLKLMDTDVDVNSYVDRVSSIVDYTRAPAESHYTFYANYDYVYKNYSYLDVECRLMARGVLKERYSSRIYSTFEKKIHDYKLRPMQSIKISGKVGIYGYNDDDYVVSMQKTNDCW